MSDLLSTSAPVSSDISMILQLTVIGVILVGFVFAKRRSFMPHGIVMFIAMLLNTGSILVVMVPGALRLGDSSFIGFNMLFRTHAILGLIVEAAAIYILADWRFQKPGPTCFQRKKWMLTLTLLWIGELILGMLLYMRLYPLGG
ncbi:hypothetical protein H8D76_02625 [Candidatus Bathyarchaeota archaeon]|nr:hypothetical protein [Candidatus Bathyarchaeota archaeon]